MSPRDKGTLDYKEINSNHPQFRTQGNVMFAMAYEHVELVESFIASSVTIQSYTNISIRGEGCLLPSATSSIVLIKRFDRESKIYIYIYICI